ncbi:MAG: IS6 family transposase [Legionellaceae bacterium]|nr:IS6 family transposase [Legionellaceae bacterium]
MLPKLKGYRYPWSIISFSVYLYHRFSLSYRDIEEMMLYRGISISYESIRKWCLKFASHFNDVLKKKEPARADKWHLDEMSTRINGEKYILWRAVDSEGYELDLLIQKRKNKRAEIRFLKRLLGSHPEPLVIVTDKLRSYLKPVKTLCTNADHRRHKGLNNRVENAHQPTRRREKSMIKMKSVTSAQTMLSLMGTLRNSFSIDVGRYKNTADVRRVKMKEALESWQNAASQISCA